MEAKLSRLLDEPEVNPAGDTERALPASMSTLEAGRGFGVRLARELAKDPVESFIEWADNLLASVVD